jgi:hypothetical protein
MKAKDFAQFLNQFSEVLSAQGANNASVWSDLAKIFEIKPRANVADVCKQIEAAEPSAGRGINDLIDGMRGLKVVLSGHAKKALIDDLARVMDALSPHRNSSIEELSSAVRTALQASKSKPARSQRAELNVEAVGRYLRQLETALGDEAGFVEVFELLKKDKAIKTPEAKRLAREFAKGAASSKEKALNLIWGRHASLMQARAKAAATAGRTAA